MKLLKRLTVIPLLLLPFAVHAQVQLTNPLGETDLRVIIGRIINGVLSVTGSIALLMIVYGGFLWMTASGRPEQIDKGKKLLVWALLGLILIGSAYVITNAVLAGVLTGDVDPTKLDR